MPLQLKHLGSDVLQIIYSFDDSYRQYYSNAVLPMIHGFVVAYCQGCRRWLDGNSDNENDCGRSHYSSPVGSFDNTPIGSPVDENNVTIRFQEHLNKSKFYTKEVIPTFYNIQTTYCHRCEGWILSRKY